MRFPPQEWRELIVQASVFFDELVGQLGSALEERMKECITFLLQLPRQRR